MLSIDYRAEPILGCVSYLAGPGVCHHNRVASDGRSVNTEAAVAQIARS